MIKNYFLIALRNISRNKFYSFLNIFGLVTGLLVAGFLILFILDELSFDTYHEKHERIYRQESHFKIGDKHDDFASSAIAMGPALKIEFPEVETFVRFADADNVLFEYGDNENYEDLIYFADSTVFDVFTHPFILGVAETALVEPSSIVLTKSLAQKYFGDNNPIGETIQLDHERNYQVTGVIEDVPQNSHLRFRALLSMSTLTEMFGEERFNSLEPGSFWNINPYTYILLKENADAENILENFPAFYDKYMKTIGDQINASFNISLTPLADVHHSQPIGGDLPKGNKAYIWIFSLVALFILSLASINYMNLATARSSKRAREVGIRKVAGAYNGQIRRQFLNESVFMAVTAFVLAMIFMELLLPYFNEISGKSLEFGLIRSTNVVLIMLGIALFTGFASGIYPAFYLAGFEPVEVLKGRLSTGGKSGFLRKLLVVFQFLIAIVMITGTIVVGRQLDYFQTSDQGYSKENLISCEVQDTTFRWKLPEFKKLLMQNPHILEVSCANGIPGRINSILVMRVEQQDGMKEIALNLTMVDTSYIDVLGLNLIKGRNFYGGGGSTDLLEAAIINEAAAKKLGWHDNPIGKKIHFGIDGEGNIARPTKVIGVVKDFNYRSLHNPVEPLVLFLTRRPGFLLNIKMDGVNTAETLGFIEENWNQFTTTHPFDYEFLSKSLEEMYQSEKKLSVIFNIAAGFSIFIALLGLLGLASFMAEQKTREIGIRKVMGANIMQIFILLYREFAVLVLIAFVISIPVAHLLLNQWLQQFASHTNITAGVYILAGVLSGLITLFTVSWHILKAATANPANAIKYE